MKNKHLKENRLKNRTEENEKTFHKVSKRRGRREKTPEKIKKNKKIRIIVLIILVFIFLATGIHTAISVNSWKSLVQEMSKNENSIVKDTDGKVIAEIGSEKAKNKISSSEIPSN